MERTVAAIRFRISFPFLLKIRITILSNTEIRAGRFGVRIPVGALHVLVSKTGYTGSGARPASCPMDNRVLVPGAKRPVCEVDH